jgi:microcystin-dependent protein
MDQPYLGEIKAIAGKTVPDGWLICDGSELLVIDHPELAGLLHGTYGGDGVNSFCVPNLSGRIQLGHGDATRETTRRMPGQTGGVETVMLRLAELPIHNHMMSAVQKRATATSPVGGMPATPYREDMNFYGGVSPEVKLADDTIGRTGGGAPHTNVMPGLVLTYIIARAGKIPSANANGED